METVRETDKRINGLFVVMMLALGLLARWLLFDFQSGDFVSFLAGWMEECHKAGGWAYVAIDPLRSDASSFNYGCMYQYVICILTMFRGTLPDLYLIKIVSVFFDILCALAAAGIVYEVSEKNERKTLIAFGAVIALPSIVLNSAAWAQADSIYTFFLLMSFLMCLKERHLATWVFFGLSLSLKLQAMFFLPFLLIAWLLKKTKLRYVVAAAAAYLVTLLPAYLLGRPMYSLMEVYTSQVGLYTQLSMNYPNIYTVIPDNIDVWLQELLIPSGVVITVMLLTVLAYVVYTGRMQVTKMFLLTLAVFSMELVVFCLPVMHERYGYAAGLLALLYGLFGAKRLACAVGIEALTLATYARFLFSSTVIKLYPLAAVLLLILLIIGADLWQQMDPCNAENLEARTRQGKKNLQKVSVGAVTQIQTEPEKEATPDIKETPDTKEASDTVETEGEINVDFTAPEYISEAAAAGVPRVSDIHHAMEEGIDLKLQPQEGDAPEDVMNLDELGVPTVSDIVDAADFTIPGTDDGTDRDRKMPEQETTGYHAPTLEELFGAEYATDR